MNQQRLDSFLAVFYPDEDEPIHLRAFGPKKAPHDDHRFTAEKIVTTRRQLAEDEALQQRLRGLNETRGVFFVVNSGGDTDESITRYNAFFAEDDSRSISDQHQILDTAPLAPSIRVETRKSVHAYWLTEGKCDEEEWRDIQLRLIAHFGGDEQIKNPSRLMRLPYFKHVTFDKVTCGITHKPVDLVGSEPEHRYTPAEMRAAFPPLPAPATSSGPTSNFAPNGSSEFTSWEELHAEAAWRIRQSLKARTNHKGWTHAPGVCHGGAEGTAQFVSPDGAYGCHKGCSAAQVRTSHGLPERLNTPEPEARPSTVVPRGSRASRFTFTTLEDLLAEPEEIIPNVWERTLPLGGLSICAAKPKLGKSTFARNLAVAVSRGEEFFGRPTVKGKVIYLCLEEKRAEVARHFRKMGADGTNIIIHTGRTPSDAFEALKAAIEEHQPVLVIIDPLSRFVRVTDFNSYGEVTRGLEPLIDLARLSECHILAVHHNGKGEREAGDALLGSTAFYGAVDALITMRRRGQARTVETVQRYGEDLPETVVHLDPETGIIMPGGNVQTLLLGERKSAVLEATGNESLTEGAIKERVGGNQALTPKAVRALVEEGRLQRIGAGKKGDPYCYLKVQPADATGGLEAEPGSSE
jgi:hypothetical protein